MEFLIVITITLFFMACITSKEGDYGCLSALIAGALMFGAIVLLINLLDAFDAPGFLYGLIVSVALFALIFGGAYVLNKALSSGTTAEQDIEAAMKRHGYTVGKEMIHKLATHPRSPAIHPPHKTFSQKQFYIPQVEWYNWLCEEETRELHYLSFEDLGKKLGVPLEKIPIDKSSPNFDTTREIMILAQDYILRKEGLRYRDEAMGSDNDRLKRPYLYDFSSDGYRSYFFNFVDNYPDD